MPSARDATPGLPAIALLLLAVAARLALAGWGVAPADPDNYVAIARSLAQGEGLRMQGRLTAYRPPLYPLLLTPLVRLAGTGPALAAAVALLHAGLGALTVALVMATARRWGLSTHWRYLAGLLVGLDPVLVAQSRVVMTETLAACLVALVLWALAAPNLRCAAIVGGLAMGLAVLCRPSLLATAGLIVAAIALTLPHRYRDRLRMSAYLLAALTATLVPWALRNQKVFGESIWTTTHGGYTLALGNNEVYYRDVLHGPPGAVFAGPEQHAWWATLGPLVEGCNEPQADRAIARHTLRVIAAHPGDFALSCMDRLKRLWGFAPSPGVYGTKVRLAVACWTLPFWLLVGLGLADRRSWSWPRVAAAAFLIALTAVHSVFWTDQRMRAPVVPALALLAAAGASRRVVSKTS